MLMSLEQRSSVFCVCNLSFEIQLLNESASPCFIQGEKINLLEIITQHQIITETSYFLKNPEIPFRLLSKEWKLYFNGNLLTVSTQLCPVNLSQRCSRECLFGELGEYLFGF